MDAIYIEYYFTIIPKELGTEILIAELGFAGFESFVENKEGVIAYIKKQDWNPKILNGISILKSEEFKISFDKNEIPQTNWNSEWEKNFEQIEVDNLVSIRAPFHKNLNLKYDIVIEPKMSFGTGHHETTYMMIQLLIKLDLDGKRTLDMGCGTGILAIFTEMKGANTVDAIDIDSWCYKNSIENIERNNCKNISVYEGNSSLLTDKRYDVIIANISRNILLNDIKVYAGCLQRKGTLLLSGFYKEDISIIDEEASKHGLSLKKTIEKNNWVALEYIIRS